MRNFKIKEITIIKLVSGLYFQKSDRGSSGCYQVSNDKDANGKSLTITMYGNKKDCLVRAKKYRNEISYYAHYVNFEIGMKIGERFTIEGHDAMSKEQAVLKCEAIEKLEILEEIQKLQEEMEAFKASIVSVEECSKKTIEQLKSEGN